MRIDWLEDLVVSPVIVASRKHRLSGDENTAFSAIKTCDWTRTHVQLSNDSVYIRFFSIYSRIPNSFEWTTYEL